MDEFFRFLIWNELSGGEEEEDSSFIEDEEREGSISATDLFAEIDDFDDIITDDSDYFDDDGHLPQVSHDRVRFSLSLKKRGMVLPCKPVQKFPEDVYN